MSPILRWIDRLSTLCGIGASISALVLICVCLYEVFVRYALNAPTLWSYDVAYMASGATALLAGGYAIKQGSHVRVDFLSSRLPPRVEAAAYGLFCILIAVPACYMIGAGAWTKLSRAFLNGELDEVSSWAPQTWPFYTLLTIGFFVFTVQLLASAARSFLIAVGVSHDEGRA